MTSANTATAPKRRPLETVRAEDYIEYFLFPACANVHTPNDNSSHSTSTAGAVADVLEQTARQANAIAAQFGANYIWHKDGFRVAPRHGNASLLIDSDGADDAVDRTTDPLPGHLYGITYFDDNIQDEWFVVALLFELTRRIDGLIVRCVDADGEFVLIEAADHLPGWANPETCAEKIFITAGHLHLVNTAPVANATTPPPAATISASLAALRHNAAPHRMSAAVHTAVAARLADYPDNIVAQLHRQRVYVPLPAAALLAARPQLVAAAVRAFCQRDPVDMRACRAMRHFPPECRVRTSVTFTRYLYAMLAHSAYTPDRRTGWQLPPAGHAEHLEHSIGVKLACGFEILAAQAAKPEAGDLAADRQWLAYRQQLERRGYFQELLEGSQGHQRLLASATEYFRTHVATATTFGREAGTDVVELLKQLDFSEEEFRAREANLAPSDDAAWLNVSAEELDAMLASRYGIRKSVGGGSAACNGNDESGLAAAAELTGNITEFLEQKSEWDGVQVERPTKGANKKSVQFENGVAAADARAANDDSLNTSTTVDFNPDDFHRHVQEMLDLVIPEDDWDSQSDMSDFENDEQLEANIERMATDGKAPTSMKSYMDEMDAELARTTIGQSFELKKGKAGKGKRQPATATEIENGMDDAEDDGDFDDIENFKPVDIDVNTLKHMAHSYRSQFGGPGPASSLLGSMGIRVNPEQGLDQEEKVYNTQV